MKTGWKIAFIVALLYFGYQFLRDDSFQHEEPVIVLQQGYHPQVIAYDWENDREITKSMADTMHFSGGHWKNGRIRTTDTVITTTWYEAPKEPSWILPSGSEKKWAPVNSPAERFWRYRQDKIKQASRQKVSEDDIRQAVEEQLNY